MILLVKRVLGLVMALLGLGLVTLGLWFAAGLGSAGTATFTMTPPAGVPVLLDPAVLNRIDGPVVVSATSARSIWLGRTSPADMEGIVGKAARAVPGEFTVKSWRVTATTEGTGVLGDYPKAEIWHEVAAGTGSASLTVQQADAPESVLVVGDQGGITSLTLSYAKKSWFVQSVVAALVGLFLLLSGALMLWTSFFRRRRSGPGEDASVPVGPSGPTPELVAAAVPAATVNLHEVTATTATTATTSGAAEPTVPVTLPPPDRVVAVEPTEPVAPEVYPWNVPAEPSTPQEES